jgi:Flp pilus assembly pilin Flp
MNAVPTIGRRRLADETGATAIEHAPPAALVAGAPVAPVGVPGGAVMAVREGF